MSIFTILWLLWGAVFLIVEGSAIFITHKTSDTLSGTIWRWFSVKGGHWTWKRFTLLGFLLWLLVHLVFGVLPG